MQWGWNPDTVAAVTTALAALAAIVAGYFAWGAYALERRRELIESERDKRAVAEQVSAWAEVREEPAGTRVDIHVQNLAASPVYEVRLGIEASGKCNYAGWARVIPPSRDVPSVVEVTPERLERWDRWTRSRIPKPVPYIEFTFCDAAGAWWHRSARGVLTEITDSEKYRYGSDSETTVGEKAR
ncbi:hypothetical protein MRBLWO14_001568 [Microbacterium sp. LWO14-1.2]|uniref:hypothetical protein n=1 Tax=Microbacterium sp. LWO14-1.2 TaxID=3135263 RepID=UPI0031386841